MKINMNIKELRKKLMNDKFIVRIRKTEDKVYYNGIKVFELKENKKNHIIQMEIPQNLYQYSFDDIKKIYVEMYKEINSDSLSKEDFNIKKELYIKEELNLKINLLKAFEKEKYFYFEMSSISFNKAGDRNYSHEEMTTKFKNFYNDLTKNLKVDLSHINIEEFLKDFEAKGKTTITFNNPITNIQDIIYIQYYYYKDLKMRDENGNISECKKTTSSIQFEKSSIIKSSDTVVNDNEISPLLEKIKNVVKTSNVKEYEKRYQFMFMLYASNSNLFGEGCYPFEQEYEFINRFRKQKKDTKKLKECRIDCVFFKYIKNKVTDLYLIELKVDDPVISSENGVLTHLDDINSLFFNKSKENINYKFFNDIRENIEYRMKELYDDFEYNYKKDKIDFNVHFYTIFGFTNEECKKNIKYVLENLKTREGIKKLLEETGKLKLDSYFKNLNLKTYVNNKINYNKGKEFTYDFKFFFDKDIFDFEDWKNNLYRDNMNFICLDMDSNIEKIKW